jgi:hypothetical protein
MHYALIALRQGPVVAKCGIEYGITADSSCNNSNNLQHEFDAVSTLKLNLISFVSYVHFIILSYNDTKFQDSRYCSQVFGPKMILHIEIASGRLAKPT